MYAQCLGTAYVRQKHRLMQNSLQAASLLPGAAAESNLLQIYLMTPLVFGCNMKRHRLEVSLSRPMMKIQSSNQQTPKYFKEIQILDPQISK